MTKICITGDSWGCGEWGELNGEYQLLHTGLQHYLELDGHTVVNVSGPASSNLEAYQRLTNLNLDKFDYIIVFHTDPCRDYEIHDEYIMFDKTLETYLAKYKEATTAQLERLNQIGRKIYIIGGDSKLSEADIAGYNNLQLLIPSVIELLCPQFKHNFGRNYWLHYLIDNASENRELINYIYDQWELYDIIMKSRDPLITHFFHPDGGHANRNGHYEFYKIFKKFIAG